TALQVVQDANTLLTPFLPHSAQKVHELLGGKGVWAAQPELLEVEDLDVAGRINPILTGDYAGEQASWESTPIETGRPLEKPVALHPTRTTHFSDNDRAVLEKLAAAPRVVCVGETGLDHYWDYSPQDAQQHAFRWHIDLAKRVGKPLMIHCRDAHEDVLRILSEEGAPETVVFHCFSGDTEIASRCVSAG